MAGMGPGDFTGLLAGLAVLDDGRDALCLGRSGYGSDYFVRMWPDPKSGPSTKDFAIGFCTRLLGTDGSSIFYATKQARLGKISGGGAREWEIVLPQIPTALAVTREGWVSAGHDSGRVTLVRPNGAVERSFAISLHPITAVAFLKNNRALISVDRAGGVALFNRRGDAVGRYASGAGRDRICAVIERDEGVLLVGSNGNVHALELPRTLPAMSLAVFETVRAVAIAGFSVLMFAGLMTLSARAMSALRQHVRQVFLSKAAYFLLLPTFLLLAVFNYFPMATALGYSFWSFSLTSPAEFVGFDNFRTMAADPYVRQGTINMAILLVTGVVKMMVLPLLAAELVFWLASRRLQQFFQAAVTFPAIVPGVVMVLVWKMIYDPYSGLLNLSLRALGLAKLQHAWLGDEHYALWAVVFFNFPWINLLIFLIFLGGLLQVERDIFDAAEIDGASVAQRFIHIDLPALRPKLMLALTLIFLWSVQDYTSVLVLTGGGPGVSTYVPALQMFQQISGGQNLGYSSAIGLVLFALVLGFTFFTRRFNREEFS
ncbi:MAG: hypothetical protein JWM35_1092, partial [Verrucomicrobia bacterium]|nr:hypothetical protein [Verrucomicrobiota bacterium]